MRYEIDHSEGCVQIKIHEPITEDLAKSFAKDAIETAKQNGLRRFFADVRGVSNVADTLSQYKMAYEEVSQLGLDRGSRIAVLVSQGDHSHDFIETVFQNTGYSFRLFTDEDESRRWLNE